MARIKLGSIYACIAGDHRYGTRMDVVLVDGDLVEVSIVDTNPIGGMDGPGGTDQSRSIEAAPRLTGKLRADAKAVLEAVRRVIRSQAGDTIREYGKPTKRFSWNAGHDDKGSKYPGGARGLSLAIVADALDLAVQMEALEEGRS